MTLKLYIEKGKTIQMLMHFHVLIQPRIIITLQLLPQILIMDKQLYQDLIQYLTTLTFTDGITDKRKTLIRKNSTHYIYQHNILFRKTKEGLRKVILPEQVEFILYHFHTDM